jgi:hypothetical protein
MTIKKNPEKSGAWLAKNQWYIGDGTNGQGVTYSAWTTQAAAKRWCASEVGRSRLTWKDVSETELTATHSEKIQ